MVRATGSHVTVRPKLESLYLLTRDVYLCYSDYVFDMGRCSGYCILPRTGGKIGCWKVWKGKYEFLESRIFGGREF